MFPLRVKRRQLVPECHTNPECSLKTLPRAPVKWRVGISSFFMITVGVWNQTAEAEHSRFGFVSYHPSMTGVFFVTYKKGFHNLNMQSNEIILY